MAKRPLDVSAADPKAVPSAAVLPRSALRLRPSAGSIIRRPLKPVLTGPKGKQRPRALLRHERRPLDAYFMKVALREAARAARRGEVPVGAVLVWHNRIIARAGNRVEEKGSALAHAELLVLEAGARQLGWRLCETALYVTLEPCAMCTGALLNARVGRLVFGTPDPARGCCGSACDLTRLPNLFARVRVARPVLSKRCAALLRTFFQQRRAQKRK
uniref:nucleoside deaminase n=1 Tax=Ndongobacter massiliensis TaxID=1871025 RepID=UPI000A5DD3E0|nr:nucleoside deaminase [Ndongobacter massiliensis]